MPSKYESQPLPNTGDMTSTSSGVTLHTTGFSPDCSSTQTRRGYSRAGPDSSPGFRSMRATHKTSTFTTVDYRIYPVVDHLTDKLVAMTSTFAGDRPSTRYRELVDIVLIAQSQTIDATELQVAVESECHHRGHSLPLQLTLADKTRRNGYSAIARTVPDLSVQAADDALTSAVSLFQPIFDGRANIGLLRAFDRDRRRCAPNPEAGRRGRPIRRIRLRSRRSSAHTS